MSFSGHQLMLILAALISEDRTALGIVEAVAQATEGGTRISTSSIYTQLERLERQGLIRGNYRREKLRERKGRPRRYYKILAQGHAAVNQVDLVRGIVAVRNG